MKQLKYCMILICFFVTKSAIAQVPFTAGNIVVCRIGDGSAVLGSAATPVFLDEYTPAGTFVQSIPMPVAINGSNNILTLTGTGVTEGMINLSVDRQYITITGYGAPPTTTGIATSAATTWPRVVGLINYNANINTTTGLTDFGSSGRPTSAITTNGTDIWVVGSANAATGGQRYTTVGSSTSVQLTAPASSTTVNNCIGIANGQLYVSRTSSEISIGTVGTGLPTTGGQTVTQLPGFPVGGTLGQFFFADLDAGVAGVDVLYVANYNGTTGALYKYSLVGGTWTLNGSVGGPLDLFRGLMATVSGSTVTLYVTKTGNQIVTLTDATGYNGAFSGTPTLLVTAATNTAFRGIAAAPVVSGSLPVKLSNLTAVKTGKDVELRWTSSSETNFSHFEIERSKDGHNYVTAGKVHSNSAGGSGNDYSFKDEKILDVLPQGSTIIYRLKMVDIDHRFEYSRSIPVRIDQTGTNSLSIYPNPVVGNNDVFVKVNASRETRLDIAIIDLAGRNLGKSDRLKLFAGENIVLVSPLKNMPSGVYFVRLVVDDKASFIKIVKQ
jgi:hypothetical protein